MDAASARALLTRFAGARVLVVGDVMLDHFLIGRVDRISPEAPVPVVLFAHDEYRLGGAANVAHGVRALGGRAELVGLVGEDEAARQVREELTARGIGAHLVADAGRGTTRKLRIVTLRHQQVARVDYEADAEADPAAEAALADGAARAVEGADAIVISDYLKGTVTRGLVARILEAARPRRTPVLVDPKIPHLEYYAGAALVTPNHYEAEAATRMRIRTPADAREAARAFRALAGCDSVLITRGEHGMWLLDGSDGLPPAGSGRAVEHELPAAAREVADVTGAGDTVVATIALGLAAGASLLDAARLANHAAGIVVGKFGPATVSPEELMEAVANDE